MESQRGEGSDMAMIIIVVALGGYTIFSDYGRKRTMEWFKREALKTAKEIAATVNETVLSDSLSGVVIFWNIIAMCIAYLLNPILAFSYFQVYLLSLTPTLATQIYTSLPEPILYTA